MAEEFYRQCALTREVNGVKSHMVSRLPEKFAVVGRYLELWQEESQRWEDHWQVMGVGETRFDAKLCNDANHGAKDLKRVTDIPRNSTEKLDTFKSKV